MEEQGIELSASNGVLVVNPSNVRSAWSWLWPAATATTIVVSAGGSVDLTCRTSKPLRLLGRLRSCEPATTFELRHNEVGKEDVCYNCCIETPASTARMAWLGQRTTLTVSCRSHPNAVSFTSRSSDRQSSAAKKTQV